MGNQTKTYREDPQVEFLTARLQGLEKIVKKANDMMIVQEATTRGLQQAFSGHLDTNRQLQGCIADNARKIALLREQLEAETS